MFCILALIDGLPSMEVVDIMEQWLDPAVDLLNTVRNEKSKQKVRGRFWDVLSGELDVEIVVGWWASMGGRDRVALGSPKSGGAGGVGAMS
jgi:hypothetical protein